MLLLIALVSPGLITLLTAFRNAIGNVYKDASNVLNNNSTIRQAS